jgi:hypothetical protein
MGTRSRPRLPVPELIRRYQGGESLSDLSMRAGIGFQALKTILCSHGVVLRTQEQAAKLGRDRQMAWTKDLRQ